ncbi:MAG: diaminopimelate decarboxylase, partial [Candidatus Gribaldobacteria bacterium]|nr:diaminopimelate decarboxylase [Candidatus Gribaldobacteria bacterium]
MLIKETITKKKLIMDMVGKHSSPFFIFDKKQLFLSFNQFADAFSIILPKENIFYAVKSNTYLPLVKEIVKLGGSLDVSSASEFEMALKCGSKKILFSGTGKTLNDLSLAVSNREKVIVNIDS